jgi:TonB-dependent starch-binding outer membrane protein SusC
MKKHLQTSTRWLFIVVMLYGNSLSAAPLQEFASIAGMHSGPTGSQQNPTGQPSRKSLRDVLKLLEADYNVSFNFDDDVVKEVVLKNEFSWTQKEKLEKILKRLLSEVRFRFEKLNDTNYLIFPANKGNSSEASKTGVETSSSEERQLLQNGDSKGAETRNVHTVSGQVKDEGGMELPGVNILVKGTTSGTTTDASGRYSINVDNGNETLVFSYIGFTNLEIAISGRTVIDVSLVPNIQSLAEVVVVAYGEVKKEDLTGSVSTIRVEEIKKVAATSLDQSLQGRAAGVQITQNSASPGGSTTIRIRGGNSIQGDNEPLYVIDGIPFKNEAAMPGSNNTGSGFNVLSTLNPSDIESMTVLKDASSTAIYGSRGANGVVIITTKRGKAGKSTINFETYYGVQQVRRKYPILNGMEYAAMVNDANTNEGKPAIYTQAQIDSIGVGTDWQDEIFGSAPIANYQLNISGGDEKTQYALSGNYFDQEGIVANTGFSRGSLRLNLDRALGERIKIGNSLTISRTLADQSRTDGELGAPGLVTMAALQYPPIIPVRNADGTYFMTSPLLNFTADNPVALANDSKNRNTAFRGFGNFFADAKITEGLNFRVSFGIDGILLKNDNYLPRSVQSGLAQGGVATISNNQSITWLNENLLTYHKKIGTLHDINILVGYTQQANRSEFSRVASRNFVNDILGTGNIGLGSVALTPASEIGTWGLNSYLGRVNYGYNEKYLLTASLRADGSSRFGINNRYAFFPSMAIAWRLKEESFLKDVRTLSDLKLRATYGTTGNQDGIGNYPSLALLGTQNYVLGNSISTGIGPNQIANPNLTWETTGQADIGIDVELFEGRVMLTGDVYRKKTTDLLLSVTIPAISGYTSAIKNLGSVENKGLELSLATRILIGEFRWSTDINFSMNRSTILDIGGAPQIFAGSVANIGQNLTSGVIRVGEPLGTFYGYVTDGLYQSNEELSALVDPQAKKPGDRKYKDLNSDGLINDLDRTIIGHAQPKWIGGFTNSFSYHGFDLSIFLQGVYGNDILNANRFELEYLNGTNNLDRDMLQRWTPENTNTDIPRASTTRPANRISTRQIEDGSYLRLKNVQLAYNFPKSLIEHLKLQSVRVYVTAQNYWTLTRYSGFDPEVNRFGQDNRSQGFDYASYPAAKTVMGGIHIGF